jgi:uncharacterized protein
MNFNNLLTDIDTTGTITDSQINSKIETTFSRTFMRMGITLFIAFGLAYGIAMGIVPIKLSFMGAMIASFGGFGLIIRMQMKRQTMSYSMLAGLLMLFWVLQGYGLSGVFLAYNLGSVYNVFLSTSVLFLTLAVVWYTTKIDVSRVGGILSTALIALLVSMLINMFWGNPTFSLWLNIAGVVIFSGMTVYEVANLKQMALVADDRMEIMMALSLFLTFVNLFRFMLSLFGVMGNDD